MISLLLACQDPTSQTPTHTGETGLVVDTLFTEGDLPDTDTGPSEPPLASADVVIIGGGGSGLTAGVVALEAGASVLVIEREHMLGGSGGYAGNFFGVGTSWQQSLGIDDSPEKALEEWAACTNGGDPEHPWVQRFLYDSAEHLEWLGPYGATIGGLTDEDCGGTRRIHTLMPNDKGHPVQSMGEVLKDYAMLNTTGIELVTAGGAVIGVMVEQEDGSTGWIEGGAVIVATGGFARSDERVYAALPELKALPRHTGGWQGADGNGLALIEGVGGALENMEHIAIYGHSTQDGILGSPEIQLVVGVESGMLISQSGQRIMSEDDLRSVWGGRAALTHGQLYVIYDQPMWQDLQMNGFGYNYKPVTDGVLTGAEYAALVDLPKGSTIQELGKALSLDGNDLLQNVAAYNAMVDAGEDTVFGRDLDGISAVRTPPFTALPIAAATGKSFGGAALGLDGSVLDADGEPIPGLFAAGEVAGMLGGDHIGMGISGSIAAVTYTGRVAGAGAAAYALE